MSPCRSGGRSAGRVSVPLQSPQYGPPSSPRSCHSSSPLFRSAEVAGGRAVRAAMLRLWRWLELSASWLPWQGASRSAPCRSLLGSMVDPARDRRFGELLHNVPRS
jgi:hypothetical protein